MDISKEINELKYEATNRCFVSPQHEVYDIMKEMIELAFLKGMKLGEEKQKVESRQRIAELLIP